MSATATASSTSVSKEGIMSWWWSSPLTDYSTTSNTKKNCRDRDRDRRRDRSLQATQMSQSSGCACSCQWQTVQEAQLDAYNYLRSHILAFDMPFSETLGFSDDESSNADGLNGGLVGPTVQYALQSKVLYQYTDALPKHIWREYVLSYATVNEARCNWRPYLHSKLSPLIPTNSSDMAAAVYALNLHMWDILAPKGVDRILFVAEQTPLIFDPMSVLVYGYASCTGLAILFIAALRSVGIPARLVGTPAWFQNRDSGNHNWLEVWKDDHWIFLEPTALKDPEWVDHLEVPPCQRWFCNKNHFNSWKNSTKVYAARLENTSGAFYRMAWEWDNQDVPGEDVTARYHSICSKC
jgi:transglutaminase/protease-like cytokinesis protein 3